jgi:hypothetical protein
LEVVRERGRIAQERKRHENPEKYKALKRAAYRRKVGEENVKAFNRIPEGDLVVRLDEAHLGRYKYVSGYLSMNAKAQFRCVEHGVVFDAMPHNLLRGAQSCPHCSHLQSEGEESLATFISQFTEVQRRRRDLLGTRHEIDIYIPEHNLGVEYHGLFWHTQDRIGNLHRKKWELAAKAGMRLVQIFEDEWIHNRAMCENRIRGLLGVGVRRQARKCSLRKVGYKVAMDFLGVWHSQGAGSRTSECYALYDGGFVVAVATFGRLRNGAGVAGDGWEVLRYASEGTVIGGFGRLFAAFRAEHKPKEVVSWCDLRWGDGRVYKALGFVQTEVSVPDYWWADCAARVRISRYGVQKHKLESHVELSHFCSEGAGEREVMEAAGYKKVMGVGSSCWVWAFS